MSSTSGTSTKKVSILVTLSVLDLLLCEIKMSKANKQQSVKQDITKYFGEILFKGDTMVIDVLDYCCSSLQNKNIFAIGRRKHFTEAAIERCSSNL